jgi:Terminase large subunit, T4likevirus-type, N-terminal
MRTIFDLVANEWKPWFRKFKWLPSQEQQTWSPWFAFLRVLFGMVCGEADVELFHACTGRTDTPGDGFTSAWLCCGRRSGKSRMLAMIAAYLAVFRDWTPYLSPGEVPTVMTIAADRKQARVIFRYTREFLKALDVVSIERETQEVLELSNGVSVEIMTADFRSVRGYTAVALLLDEVTFWPSENANAAAEVITALTPSMATVPGAMLLCASSPYSKKGVLYDAFREHYGQNGDDVLFWKAATRTMNPSVPESFIAAETAKDSASAAAEYGAEFRDDISSFVPAEIVDAATLRGVVVIPPDPEQHYTAFIDVSGGAKDSHACAIAFQDSNGNTVLSCAREVKTPNVEAVTAEFSTLLQSYGCNFAYADQYGKEWTRGTFSRYDIELRSSPHTKNEIYLNFLPALNSGKTRILDIPRLRHQLLALERTTSRGTGRDTVNHPNAGHDDLINAAAGALVMAESADRRRVSWTCDYAGPTVDADEPDPRMDYELRERAMQIRNWTTVNGAAPTWREAVEQARKDLELAKRY